MSPPTIKDDAATQCARLWSPRHDQRRYSPAVAAETPANACRQNGPASVNSSDFLLNNHAVEPRLFEPKSLLPGNGILPAETKAPKRLRKTKDDHCGDMTHTSNPANSALLAQSWEISVSEKVRGGAERTRTACQARSRYRTGLWRVIPPRQFCDQMSPISSDNIVQKGLAFGRHWSGTVC